MYGVSMYYRPDHNVKCVSYCGFQLLKKKKLKTLLTSSVFPILTLLFLSSQSVYKDDLEHMPVFQNSLMHFHQANTFSTPKQNQMFWLSGQKL